MLRLYILLYPVIFCMMAGISPWTLTAQDHTWWNDKHNWDGVTHWTRYLIISPAYLGPNAMPVPATRSGRIDTTLQVEAYAEIHRSKGDKTEGLFASLQVPVAKGIAALKLEMTALEQYRMDTLTRDERRARDKDGRGHGVGDLLVTTLLRITRDREGWPDLNLGIHLRTTTGSNQAGARFSDSPGFYFDLAGSKRWDIGKGNMWIAPQGMLGFYTWQVNRDDNLQNDALIYGLGFSLGRDSWQSGLAWSGYHGHFNDGDRPMVIRLHSQVKLGDRTHLSLRFQQGLHDFPFTSVRLGFIWNVRQQAAD